MAQNWVCQTWKEQPELYDKPHVFEENTEDGFCPYDPPYHGILLRDTLPAPVAVSISFPENKQKFKEGTNITILAETSVIDGKVEFFVDEKKIGEDLSSPHSHTYLATQGEHSLTAKVSDNKGASATSSPVKITVEQV